MNAAVLLLIPFAAVMAAPATPNTDPVLRELINPRPEVIQKLNEVARSLQSSLAATSPEVATGTGTPANLNLLGGLNNIILRIVRGVLDKMVPGTSSPSTPSGTGVIVTGTSPNTGTNQIPSVNTASIPGIPGFMNPFNMMYPRLMFDMFENFF